MLDFSRFVKPTKAVVPVLDHRFQLKGKKYKIAAADGWAIVEVLGNDAKFVEEHFWIDLPRGTAGGITHGNALIFGNFDVAKRKWGIDVSAPLHFNSVETFSAVNALVWEDGRTYFVQPDYRDLKTFDVKDAYLGERTLDGMKGITPEMRTAYLFHSIEREQMRLRLEALVRAQQETERKEAEAARLATMEGRLKFMFERSGASLSGFSRSGGHLVVDWSLPGSRFRFNSVLDAETFRIVECGYCVSGDDSRHSVSSMVTTAKEYDEQNLIHITRW